MGTSDLVRALEDIRDLNILNGRTLSDDDPFHRGIIHGAKLQRGVARDALAAFFREVPEEPESPGSEEGKQGTDFHTIPICLTEAEWVLKLGTRLVSERETTNSVLAVVTRKIGLQLREHLGREPKP